MIKIGKTKIPEEKTAEILRYFADEIEKGNLKVLQTTLNTEQEIIDVDEKGWVTEGYTGNADLIIKLYDENIK